MNPLEIDFNAPAVRDALLALVPASYQVDSIAFAGGSLLEGFGNATSDIDLIVLSDGPLDVHDTVGYSTPDGTVVHVGRYEGVRVDIEVVPLASIKRVADQLRRANFDMQGQLDFEYELLTVLQCLRVGVPLNLPRDFQRVQDEFPWNGLAKLLAYRAESFYHNAAEDAVGAIKLREPGTSVLTSRLALGFAIDVYTAACGSTNTKVKWRFKKLEALGAHDVAVRYLEAEVEGSASTDDIIARSKSRLRFAQDLLQMSHERLSL